MTETNVFELTQPGTFSDPLTEVLRNGARTLLGQASQSNALTPCRLLRLSKNLPHDWKEQRCFLGFAA